MLKIDTHAHILPPNWPNLAEKYGDDRFPVMVQADGRHRIYKDGKFFREVWANAFDPEVRIADYAKFGVDVQVVSTVPVLFSYWAKPSQALELHRHLNDHTAGLCRKYPRHYAGIGTVPLQSPTLAIRELERCVDQLGLQGVQIGSHINDWNLDAPELFDFFQAASELDAAPIMSHGCTRMAAPSSAAASKNGNSSGASRFQFSQCEPICTPDRPSCSTQRSISWIASVGDCSGTVPMPA